MWISGPTVDLVGWVRDWFRNIGLYLGAPLRQRRPILRPIRPVQPLFRQTNGRAEFNIKPASGGSWRKSCLGRGPPGVK